MTFSSLLKRSALLLPIAGFLIFAYGSGTTAAPDDGREYEITVTNLTRGQQFTPVLVATHRSGLTLFALGSPASSELAVLAEEGNTAPLTSVLLSDPRVREVTTSGPLLDPGKSRTITIGTAGSFNSISLAAMLIPTNDAFFALNDVELPIGGNVLTAYSPAYDAGSERNDELCVSIPGPFFIECGGPGGGGAPVGMEEGYVHIHAGIHGIGNLNASMRDWRNPVAQIMIRRMK